MPPEESSGGVPSRLSGPALQRVRYLGAATFVYALAIALWLIPLSSHTGTFSPDHSIAIWFFPLLCCAGAYLQIEFHDYKISSTVSFLDTMLILGLFLVPPPVVLGSYMLGGALARSIRRGTFAWDKEYSNTSQGVLNVAITYLVFFAFNPDPQNLFSPRDVGAAVAASIALWLSEEFCFTLGYSALQGKVDIDPMGSLTGLVAVVVNSSIALVGLVFVVHEPFMTFSLAPLVFIVLLFQQSATDARQKADQMEFLYKTNELLHATTDTMGSTLGLLDEISAMFHARRVELLLRPEGGRGVRLFSEQGASPSSEPYSFSDDEGLLLDALGGDTGLAVRTGSPEGAMLDAVLADRATATGMGARISALGTQGLLLLFDSTSARKRFAKDDVPLLLSLAAQLRSALERGQMSEALASAAAEKEELTHLATHDPLTRLANRALFNERTTEAVTGITTESTPAAVLFIDLDDFKLVNDTYGHAAGDTVLLTVSDRLRAVLRASDLPSRFGGDEFGLLIENLASVGDAAALAQRVVTSVGEYITLEEGVDVRVRASVGVAIVGGGLPGCDAAELLRRADAAMYVSKRSGKGQFTIYDTGAEELFAQAEREGVALQAGLERGQIKVLFEPVVELAEGHLAGAQALMRWQHPTRGNLGPEGFMTVAEKAGLVPALGRHFLGETAKQLAAWRAEYKVPDLRVAVPVFPKHLSQPMFVDEAVTVVKEAGLTPDALILTIDQTLVTERMAEIGPRLQALSREGFHLAIENFGRGGDIPLGVLRTFHFASVNLAEDLTHTLGEGEGADNEIVAGVMRVASLLKVDVIARGVDTLRQVEALRALGCTLAQGGILGEPAAAEQFRHHLRGEGIAGPAFGDGGGSSPKPATARRR